MWELWRRAKAFSVTPSNLLRIDDKKTAFWVDRGIWMFCSGIENEMDEASNKAKNPKQAQGQRHQVLMKYLHPGETKGLYRDPAAGASSTGTVAKGEDFFKNARRKRR